MSWCAYLKKRGSLHIGNRIEESSALLAVKLDQLGNVKSKMSDYTPHRDKPEEETVSIQNVFSMLQAKARKAA